MQQVKYTFLQELVGCIPIFLIMVFNIITLGDVTNVAVVIPQSFLVLYFLFTGRTDKALFYHLIFYLCCISSETSGMEHLYSYSRLKVLGPLNISDVNILLILFLSLRNKRIRKYVLFEKLNKMYLYLFISASLIGLFGVVFLDYEFGKYVNKSLYLTFTIIHAFSILLNDTCWFRKHVVDNVYRLLWCASLSTSICFFVFGFTISHSGVDDLFVGPDVKYLSPILFFGLFEKNKAWILFGIFSYVALGFMATSGKGYIIFFFTIVAFLYLLYKKRKQLNASTKIAIYTGCLFAAVIVIRIFFSIDFNNYALAKQGQVISLFAGYENMANSPKVRVATLLNLIYIGLYNPIFLLFGHGYGGYFTDALHLFSTFDIGESAWPVEEMNSGKFTSAHDTFASVPLFNGLIGLYLIVKMTVRYLKVFEDCYLAFTAVIYLLLTFYFSFHIATMGVLFLYATDIMLPKYYILNKKIVKL